MKKKRLISTVVLALMVGGIAIYSAYANSSKAEAMSDVMLANLEALSEIEDGKKCPDPYDVYNHQLSFVQRTGNFEIDANLEINFFGQKIKVVNGVAGASVTITYEIGTCDLYSPGNCCPNSRNGETHVIGF